MQRGNQLSERHSRAVRKAGTSAAVPAGVARAPDRPRLFVLRLPSGGRCCFRGMTTGQLNARPGTFGITPISSPFWRGRCDPSARRPLLGHVSYIQERPIDIPTYFTEGR